MPNQFEAEQRLLKNAWEFQEDLADKSVSVLKKIYFPLLKKHGLEDTHGLWNRFSYQMTELMEAAFVENYIPPPPPPRYDPLPKQKTDFPDRYISLVVPVPEVNIPRSVIDECSSEIRNAMNQLEEACRK